MHKVGFALSNFIKSPKKKRVTTPAQPPPPATGKTLVLYTGETVMLYEGVFETDGLDVLMAEQVNNPHYTNPL